MPPDDDPHPTEDEIEAVIRQLDSGICEGRVARMAERPRVAHCRLSRKEYQNTVYDLLGVRYDPTKPGQAERRHVVARRRAHRLAALAFTRQPL